MTPENFCYWLKGWIELQNPNLISPLQLEEIKNHLTLVFSKQTPDIGNSPNWNQHYLGQTPYPFPLITC